MPDTRPNLEFGNDGICFACKKDKTVIINYKKRRETLALILGSTRDAMVKRNCPYHVLVPVSGGKDSIYQCWFMKQLWDDYYKEQEPIKILGVCVDYGVRTPEGRENLSIITDVLNIPVITYRPPINFHRGLVRKATIEFSDPDLMSHCLLYAYPLWFALEMDIPLVVYGENPAAEYTGDEGFAGDSMLSLGWFNRYVVSQCDPLTFAELYGIDPNLMKYYSYPKRFDQNKNKAIFLGFFDKWDADAHYEIAKDLGFKTKTEGTTGSFRNFVGVDEICTRIHQWFKVLKFGYGRATDHACELIRKGELTKIEARALIVEHDLIPPTEDEIRQFCLFAGIEQEVFMNFAEAARNTEIWIRNDGKWEINEWLQ